MLLLCINFYDCKKNDSKQLSSSDIIKIEEELCYDKKSRKKFNPNLYKYLKSLKIVNYENLITRDNYNPTFVMAVSNYFVPRGLALMKSIFENFPKSKLIVYDLGVSRKNVKKIKKTCNIIYKKFKFNYYPYHVSHLSNYAFKAIVISEALRDYGSIWYLDSSVSIRTSNLTKVYNLMNNKKSSYILHDPTGHGIAAGTDTDLYLYLPTNINEIVSKKSSMYQAGLIYVKKDKESIDKILKWYILCSLTKECISPKNAKQKCLKFLNNNYGYNKKHCHRYDQSIINILLWNAYKGDIYEYTSGVNDFYKIDRQQIGKWNKKWFC
uniref:Nucleotid_trans domain-containing protein n=1 Tax=Parastrongyloides trichosuri TaxID=131310 RepID=A0A0N4ZTR6_PARTI